ncbi:MAG: DUF1275 domain-containing protein [Phycisphaera sp.]|nr:DUF1275 domain-containing protein [Phycisphaera sp.]
MLSARAYSFRQKSRLAISLSWIGGYTNVIALLAGGHVVSHMTGNATQLGAGLAQGHWDTVLYLAFVLGAFMLGAVLSALLTEGSRRRSAGSKYIAPLALEALMLAVLGVGLHVHHAIPADDTLNLFWMTGLASMAMGLQNATITKVSGAVVRTTHLTGVITDLGLEGVQVFLWWLDRTKTRRWARTGRLLRISQRHPTTQRVALLASIFFSFILGVIVGAWLFEHTPDWAMALPVLFLLWIVFVDYRTPIADVREIDLLSDPELQASGLIQSLLPNELGIYRLWTHRKQDAHEAPNFQAWAEALPRHKRVVILALSPITRIDSNAALDLKATALMLRDRAQHLILAGVSPGQFKTLDRSDIDEVIPTEDLCPDVEFAIARALTLLPGGRN